MTLLHMISMESIIEYELNNFFRESQIGLMHSATGWHALQWYTLWQTSYDSACKVYHYVCHLVTECMTLICDPL